ncbi:MAG: hypothetical protein V8T01_10560 [Oscillospiraceae bacterium]
METPKVRKDLGYPPLVTPTSQMVGVQAVQNVLAGERYKNVSKEVVAYCRGEYGNTPAPCLRRASERSWARTASLSAGALMTDTLRRRVQDQAKEALGDLARSEEDVLSYICYPELAMKFFEARKAKEENICKYTIVEA